MEDENENKEIGTSPLTLTPAARRLLLHWKSLESAKLKEQMIDGTTVRPLKTKQAVSEYISF